MKVKVFSLLIICHCVVYNPLDNLRNSRYRHIPWSIWEIQDGLENATTGINSVNWHISATRCEGIPNAILDKNDKTWILTFVQPSPLELLDLVLLIWGSITVYELKYSSYVMNWGIIHYRCISNWVHDSVLTSVNICISMTLNVSLLEVHYEPKTCWTLLNFQQSIS